MLYSLCKALQSFHSREMMCCRLNTALTATSYAANHVLIGGAGGDAVQPVQGAAVLSQQGDGTLQPEPPRLLVVPGGTGLEGGQLWRLGPAGHPCQKRLLPQIRLARGEAASCVQQACLLCPFGSSAACIVEAAECFDSALPASQSSLPESQSLCQRLPESSLPEMPEVESSV